MNKIITTILMLVSGISIAQTTILMNEVNGVYYVPCEVNGIKMDFVFDTGASNVSISKTEAEFLIKQKLLTKEDFIGRVNYLIADGSIKDGIEVRLKEIKIKDLILKDVTATIVSESSAPLLLGQSALSKLGRFEVDRNILRIYPSNLIKPVDKEQTTDVKLEKIVQKMIDTGESEDKIAKVIKGFDQSREEFAKILTGTLNNEKYQIECLTYKGLLVVKIKKRFYDNKPEDYVLSPFIRNLAYDLFYEARKYKGFSEKLKTLFEGVVFQNDFTFNNDVKYEVNLGITCNDNEALLESINKEDFKSLLFTFKD